MSASDKESQQKGINKYEAMILLKRAIDTNKVNLENNPAYKELALAKQEREYTKYSILTLSAICNFIIFYTTIRAYRTYRPQWDRAFYGFTTLNTIFILFYYSSPGMRRYNEAIINICNEKKQDLTDIYNS